MTKYCKENVICVKANCPERHYKDFQERRIISGLINIDDMAFYMEDYKPSMPTCRYHLLCFERECIYNHSQISLEGRKKVIKMFKNYQKHEKAKKEIEADIAKYQSGEKKLWTEMTKC